MIIKTSAILLESKPVLLQSLFVLLTAAMPAQAQGAAPGPVNTSSGRELISSETWPWQSIGKVNLAITTQRSTCTGTLIAPDKVLTAAHCLFDSGLNNWVKPEDLRFAAGLSPGPKYADISPVLRYLISPAFRNHYQGEQPDLKRTNSTLHRSEPSMIRHDWAILTLQRPLKLKPIPVHVLTADERKAGIQAVLPGYGSDRRYALSIARNCRLAFDEITFGPGSIMIPCEVAPGGSGSPILVLGDDGSAKVIGVAAAGGQMQKGAAIGTGGTMRSTTFGLAIGASSSLFKEFAD